jgi:hypothetical protein
MEFLAQWFIIYFWERIRLNIFFNTYRSTPF